MVQSTDDGILKQDMPPALHKVENAAKLLEEAATLSHMDPYSSTARQKLIEGSRWILQGNLMTKTLIILNLFSTCSPMFYRDLNDFIFM